MKIVSSIMVFSSSTRAIPCPSGSVSVSGSKVRIEGHDDSQDQEILCWRQSNYSWRRFTPTEEAASAAAGIIDPVLQSYDCGGLTIGHAIFEGRRVCFDGLPEASQAAIAVPVNFRAHGRAPVLAKDPMRGQLGGHPKCTRISGCRDFFCTNVVFECSCNPVGFPFGNAVPQKSPEFEPSV